VGLHTLKGGVACLGQCEKKREGGGSWTLVSKNKKVWRESVLKPGDRICALSHRERVQRKKGAKVGEAERSVISGVLEKKKNRRAEWLARKVNESTAQRTEVKKKTNAIEGESKKCQGKTSVRGFPSIVSKGGGILFMRTKSRLVKVSGRGGRFWFVPAREAGASTVQPWLVNEHKRRNYHGK